MLTYEKKVNGKFISTDDFLVNSLTHPLAFAANFILKAILCVIHSYAEIIHI